MPGLAEPTWSGPDEVTRGAGAALAGNAAPDEVPAPHRDGPAVPDDGVAAWPPDSDSDDAWAEVEEPGDDLGETGASGASVLQPRGRDVWQVERQPREPEDIVERMRRFKLEDGRRLYAAYQAAYEAASTPPTKPGADPVPSPDDPAATAGFSPADVLRHRRSALRAIAIDEAYASGYDGDDPGPTLERLGQVAVETMIESGPLRGGDTEEAGAGASEGTRDAFLAYLVRPFLTPKRFAELVQPWRGAFEHAPVGHPFDILGTMAVLCLAVAFAFWVVGGSILVGVCFVGAAVVIMVARERSRRQPPSPTPKVTPPAEPLEP